MHRVPFLLGVVLILGGLAHSVGVSRFYFVKGLPDLNRILLDVWIAEAQIAAGVLFLAGRSTPGHRAWIVGGALLVWTWAIPFLPVLVHRAPPIFWITPALYSLAAAFAVLRASRFRQT